MKIKKFTGATAHEAMLKLKKELGPDAIILNTRTIKQKGLWGFLKKPIVEITAAYEKEDPLSLKKDKRDSLSKINEELIELKNMIRKMSTDIIEKDLSLPVGLDEYRIKLVENGVEDYIAVSILNRLNKQIDLKNKDSAEIRNIVKNTLIEYIGQPRPLTLNNNEQKVIFFLGPTGVGKTTTLAKIAAKLTMNNRYNIGLVTTDTYRIAAVDQLKTYSDILQLPLEVVYNEEDMYRTMVRMKDKDIILVDTAGRNHKDIKKDDEIVHIINSIKNKELYLVISGNIEFRTLKSIIEHYDFIKYYKLIFTKIDETEVLGNILNVKYLTQNPVSYITTGQNVPDDIEILDTNKIVSCLIGESSYERSG